MPTGCRNTKRTTISSIPLLIVTPKIKALKNLIVLNISGFQEEDIFNRFYC